MPYLTVVISINHDTIIIIRFINEILFEISCQIKLILSLNIIDTFILLLC